MSLFFFLLVKLKFCLAGFYRKVNEYEVFFTESSTRASENLIFIERERKSLDENFCPREISNIIFSFALKLGLKFRYSGVTKLRQHACFHFQIMPRKKMPTEFC